MKKTIYICLILFAGLLCVSNTALCMEYDLSSKQIEKIPEKFHEKFVLGIQDLKAEDLDTQSKGTKIIAELATQNSYIFQHAKNFAQKIKDYNVKILFLTKLLSMNYDDQDIVAISNNMMEKIYKIIIDKDENPNIKSILNFFKSLVKKKCVNNTDDIDISVTSIVKCIYKIIIFRGYEIYNSHIRELLYEIIDKKLALSPVFTLVKFFVCKKQTWNNFIGTMRLMTDLANVGHEPAIELVKRNGSEGSYKMLDLKRHLDRIFTCKDGTRVMLISVNEHRGQTLLCTGSWVSCEGFFF